jgi:hypothetical protein
MWAIICKETINIHMARIFCVPMIHRSGKNSRRAVITKKMFVEVNPFGTSMLTFGSI